MEESKEREKEGGEEGPLQEYCSLLGMASAWSVQFQKLSYLPLRGQTQKQKIRVKKLFHL